MCEGLIPHSAEVFFSSVSCSWHSDRQGFLSFPDLTARVVLLVLFDVIQNGRYSWINTHTLHYTALRYDTIQYSEYVPDARVTRQPNTPSLDMSLCDIYHCIYAVDKARALSDQGKVRTYSLIQHAWQGLPFCVYERIVKILTRILLYDEIYKGLQRMVPTRGYVRTHHVARVRMMEIKIQYTLGCFFPVVGTLRSVVVETFETSSWQRWHSLTHSLTIHIYI